jgi:hypothetical protein
MPSEDGIKYPICIDGARHCPPEEVGGPRGYADFLKAWCDPTQPERQVKDPLGQGRTYSAGASIPRMDAARTLLAWLVVDWIA